MKKHFLVTLTSVLIVGCAIWVGTRRAEYVMLDRHIDILRQSLGQGVFLTYDSARPGLLGRSTIFTNVVFRRKNDTITAQQAELSRPDSDKKISGIIHLSFHNVQITGIDGNLHAQLLTIDNLVLQPHGQTLGQKLGQKQVLSTHLPSIAQAHAYGIHGFIKALHAKITADSITLDHFNGTITNKLLIKNILLSVDTGSWRRFTVNSIHANGFNIAKLYWSLYHGLPLYNGVPAISYPGQRDVEMHHIEIDGEVTNSSKKTLSSIIPLLRISHLSSHITLTKTAEQETSNIQRIEIWPATPWFHWLDPLKYDHIRASLVFSDIYNLKTKHIHIKELNVTAPTIGRIYINGDITPPPSASSISTPIESFIDSPISPIISCVSPNVHIVFPDMYIVSTAITYMDYGLITRALKVLATKSNTTPYHLLATLFVPNISQATLPIPPEEHIDQMTNTSIDIHALSKLKLGLEKTPIETTEPQNTYHHTLQKIAEYLIHPVNKSIVINIHPTQPFSVKNIIFTLSNKNDNLGKILPQIIQKTGLTVVNP
ncbi:MAG: hypothetical protein J6V89_00615 [Acetobacter sp.]|nr:hypothetical protein [Acetobacter sp.]